MEKPVNEIDVNAVNARTREEAETVIPLGYEESKRLHEQMGNDMLTFLSAELGMFLAGKGYDMTSNEGKLITEYVAYVVNQWNGTRE